MKILILNGPNLNLLGTREPEIYGSVSMGDYLTQLQNDFSSEEILYFQSNIEGELINRYAIADCLKNINKPKIEVHISNIYKREEFRKKSVTAESCDAVISGFGMKGYKLAVQSIEKY
jgi:3-dehydroquinate dehydratase-2